MVREGGLEPPRLAAPEPKSGASAIPPFARPEAYYSPDCGFSQSGGRVFPYIFRLPSGKSRGTVYC